MARRRKKKSVSEELLRVGILLSFLLGYMANGLQGAFLGIVAYLVFYIGIGMYIRNKRKERLRRSGIEEIDQMDGIQFEHYLGQLFKTQGYKVRVTAASGDFGADLVLEKDGNRIVVQAKRYSKNVGLDAVQEVVASKSVYQANDAWVITNRDFTTAAYQLAEANQVRLINRQAFIDLVLQMNPEAVPQPAGIKQETPSKKVSCERCGGEMVVRKGSRGLFYGCTSFPKCRNTRSI